MPDYIRDNYQLIFIGALALLLVAVLIAAAARRRALERQLSQMNRALEISTRRIAEFSDSIEKRQDRLRGSLDERMEALKDTNDRKLDQLREIVTGKLDARLGESFRTVNEQLARVDKGLGEMRGLAADVGDLRKIMTNARARGAWGEVQLRSLLEEVLAPSQYMENTPVVPGAAERVEFAIVLPDAAGETTLIAVDSKFPIEQFLRLPDGAAAFERTVLDEGRRISSKYVRPPHTVDYAVMFLPAESLYAEVARRRGLVEKLQNECRVLVAGPSTFAALLTSLRMGFRGAALERRGAEVMAVLRGVEAEFARYAEAVDRAKQRARQLEGDLDGVEARARAVERKLREVGEE